MATEDAKSESTFIMEKENEDKEFLTDASGIQVDKLPLIENESAESLLDNKHQESIENNFRAANPVNYIEGSYESKNGEKNTEEQSRDLQKYDDGGRVGEDSLGAASATSGEIKPFPTDTMRRSVVSFEDDGSEHKFHTTSVSFEGNPHHTSFPNKEEYSEVSSPPAHTKIDPEMLHSSVTKLEEIEENSDFTENVSTGDVSVSSHSEFLNKQDEMKGRENGHSNTEQLSSPLIAELTDDIISKTMESDNVGKLEENSGTMKENIQDTTDLSLDNKEVTSSEFELSGSHNLESSTNDIQSSVCENPESIREVSDMECANIKESQPEVESQNKPSEEVEHKSSEDASDHAKESPELRCNQSIVEPDEHLQRESDEVALTEALTRNWEQGDGGFKNSIEANVETEKPTKSEIFKDEKYTEDLLAKKELEKENHTDSLHHRVPLEITVSGEDSPTVISIQEQIPIKSVHEDLNKEKEDKTSYASDNKGEGATHEGRGTHIEELLGAKREDDQKNIIEQMKEEKMPEEDLNSSRLETDKNYGLVHDQNNRKEDMEDGDLSPIEFKQDIIPSNLTVEEDYGKIENAEKNRGTVESTKEDSSLQEFQKVAQMNKTADDENNLEPLPIKDISVVTSDEIPNVVIPQTATDVILDQEQVPIIKESEETKEENVDTNLVSQASEENSSDHKAIEVVDDSIDNTNVPSRMLGNKETNIEEVHVDDKSLGTLDIYLHEKPLETINRTSIVSSSEEADDVKLGRTSIGSSSEEADDVKLGNIPGLASQLQTIEPEHTDKESITNIAENEAAVNTSTSGANRSQYQGAKVLLDSREILADKIAEDSSEEITNADPECKSVDAVAETNPDQISLAAEVVDSVEEIPSMKVPSQEEQETSTLTESTEMNENIITETSDSSFATILRGALLQNEENKAQESDVSDSPIKAIKEEHNGAETSESEPKEYVSAIDNPSSGKCEKNMELAVDEKTEDGENHNSENTNTDHEHLALSLSIGKENQPNTKEEKYKEAIELLTAPDQILDPELDIPSSKKFSKETEMKKEKPERDTTEERNDNILIKNSNQTQEAIGSNNLIEKVGDNSSSTEDSRCGSPEQEVNQETYQEDELKQEVDPGQKAARTLEDTTNASNTTKLEELETVDATQNFEKQMPSEQKVVEVLGQVSMAEEVADYSPVEGKEESYGKDTENHDETNPEAHPEIKIPSEEKDFEVTHQVSAAKETENHGIAEEIKEERNVKDTKAEDELTREYPEVTADEITNTASGSTKFEEPKRIDTTHSFPKQLQNEEKVTVSYSADQNLNSSPLETDNEYWVVPDQTNRKEYINQAIEDGNLRHEEFNQDINPSNLTVEEDYGKIENAEKNRRPTELAKEDSSLQEFQNVAQANIAADNANNIELLPIKDPSAVTSDDIPNAVIPQAATDVIWDQEQVPILKESEETEEENVATNLVSQASEENSSDHKAIEVVDDSIENTNVPSRMLGKEETSIEEVHVDDKSLGTLDIYSHENPLETINKTSIVSKSEEADDIKLANTPGLASQLQTTQPDHADKESISNLAENEAAAKASTSGANRLQDQDAKVPQDSREIKADKIAEDSSEGITFDLECKSVEAMVETNADQISLAAEVVDSIEESVKLPSREEHETANVIGSTEREDSSEGITNADPYCKSGEAVVETNADQISLAAEVVDSIEESVKLPGREEHETANVIGSTEREDSSEGITNADPDCKSVEAVVETNADQISLAAEVADSIEESVKLPSREEHETANVIGSTEREDSSQGITNADPDCKSVEAVVETNADQISLAAEVVVSIEESVKLPSREEHKTANVIGSTEREDSSEGITNADPDCKSVEAVVETNADQISLAAEVVDSIEESMKLPSREEHETANVIGSTETNENIVTETSDSSFATTLKGALLQNEENKAPESDVNDSPIKAIKEEHNGAETSESEPKEYVSAIDHPSTGKCEKSRDFDVEEQREDGENHNSENTNTDYEHLALSLSLGKDNQPNTKDENYKEAIEPLTGPDQILESELDIPSSQEFNKEMEKEKPERHTTEERNDNILIKNFNQTQEANGSDNSIEKIGDNSSSTEDSRSGSPEQEVHQETYQEDELKQEVDPGEKAARTPEDTTNASNTTKLEEPETVDAPQRFKKQIPSEEMVVEVLGQVSTAEEVADYSPVEEGKDESNAKDTENHDETNPQANPEIKFEDPERIDTPCQVSTAEDIINYSRTEDRNEETNVTDTATQDVLNPEVDPEIKADEIYQFMKNMPSEEKVLEEPHQVSTAEVKLNYSTAEEGKEQSNVNNSTINELKKEADPEVKADETTNSASETTKFEEPETIDTTQSYQKQMQNEENAVQVIEEETVNNNSAEEDKEERNANGTKEKDELKPEIVQGVMADEMSESINNSSYSTKFQEAQTSEPTQSFNKQMQSEDEIVEGPCRRQVAEEIIRYSPAKGEESNHKDPTVSDELKPDLHHGVKLKNPEMTETTQRFDTKMPSEDTVGEGHLQFPIVEDVVNYNATEEGNEERNVTGTETISEELNPEVGLGTKADEISEIKANASESTEFQQPDTVDATQSFTKQMTIEDEVIQQPHQVSTAEGIVDYCLAGGEEKNVEDITLHQLKQEVVPGFEGPETVDVNQSSKKRMPWVDMVVEGPPQDSTAERRVNYSPREDVKAAILGGELQPHVDPEIKVNESSETINNARESAKLEITKSLNKDMISEAKVIEGPPQVSMAEEIVNYMPGEEGKTERNVKDTTIRDELKTEVDPKLKLQNISQTKKNASETTKFERPGTMEATQTLNTEMQVQDKVVERPLQVSITEEAEKYNPAEERKEKRNVNDTTGDELKSAVDPGVKLDEVSEITSSASQTTKLEETEMNDINQSFKKQTPNKDKVDEEPSQVSTGEKIINYSPAEESKEERYVSSVTKEDELKPEEYGGVKKDEISETISGERDSVRFQEPKTEDATQCFNKQIQFEDKVIVDEEPHQVSTAEEIGNYSLPEAEERNVNDTTASEELNHEVDPELRADEISETTYFASETKVEEPESIDAAQIFKKQMQGEDKVVEGPSQVSNAEEIVNYNPSRERKVEMNVNDTITPDGLKPEMIVNEISDTVNNLNDSTKMASEENVVERSPQDSTAKERVSYRPAEEGKEESNAEDTTSKDKLKTERDPKVEVDEISETTSKASETTKHEEHELINVAQSLKKQMPCEGKTIEGPHSFSIVEGIVHYSPEEEAGEERIVKVTTTTEESKPEEDTGVNVEEISTTINASESTKFDDTETVDATQSFKDQMPSEDKVAEGPHQVSTGVEAVYHSPEAEGMEERNVEDRIIPEQADEFPSTNTETEVQTSSAKVESPMVVLQKYEEDVIGSCDQEKVLRNDSEVTARESTENLGEYLMSEAEPVKPVHENFRDCPNSEDVATAQTNTLENQLDHERTQESPNESQFKVTIATGGLDLEMKESCVDKAANLLLSGSSEDDESNKRESGEQYSLITEKESKEDMSSIAQESSFKDEEKEGQVEEQVKLSVHGEPHLNPRIIEGILPDADGREVTEQVDNSNMEIAQKDELVDLTVANNNFGGIRMPCISSIALSTGEIMAKEDSKTGSDAKIGSQGKEVSMQKDPTGETFHPEIEELKPEDASKAVGKAVREDYGEEKKPIYDSKEIINNFRSTMSSESSPSQLEQSGKETPQEITKKDAPQSVAREMDTDNPLDMQKLKATPYLESEKLEEEADPNYSSIDIKNLKEVQQEEIAKSLYTGENQEPAKHNDDKGSEEATGKFVSEETSVTSHPNQASIQRDEMKDGIAGTSEFEEPNKDEDKAEVEEDTQGKAESAYDSPVIVEASRDADVKVAHKKSHNILSGVGSKVKHSIAKVKKVIIGGKSSHPKP